MEKVQSQETEMVLNKTKRSDLLNIDPRNIVHDESENIRNDYGDIDSLMESIVHAGLQEPLIVTKISGTDTYRLTDGFRRMRAIEKALSLGHDIPYVKAVVGSSNPEDRLFSMVITGTNKKPLTLLEEGETYKKLKDLGYEIKEIAQKVGKSQVHIYDTLKLADLPKVVKNQITKDNISPRTVLSILKNAKTAEDIINAVDEAIKTAEVETVNTGKKAKATDRHTGKLSALKLIEKASEIATEKEYVNAELLHKVLGAIRKGLKPHTVADYFK
jgi:ParB/RepB/Spo0J family partition protein